MESGAPEIAAVDTPQEKIVGFIVELLAERCPQVSEADTSLRGTGHQTGEKRSGPQHTGVP